MSDNKYPNCPALMSDGRLFTDYKTATRRNEYIKHVNGFHRDDEYRAFLQSNGATMIGNLWNYHKTHNSCNECACVHKIGRAHV